MSHRKKLNAHDCADNDDDNRWMTLRLSENLKTQINETGLLEKDGFMTVQHEVTSKL